MIEFKPLPNVGQLLKAYIKQNRKYKSAIARYMGCSDASIQGYLSRADLRLSTLWKLSQVLEHDFLADISAQLPEHYRAHIANPLQAQVDELTKQNQLLSHELKVIKEFTRLMNGK